MTPQDMLDHALGKLEGDALDRARREIGADPELGARCGRLGRSLRLMLDEGPVEPPSDLRARTLRLVFEPEIHPIAARRRSLLDFAPRIVPFRAADVAVAAGILLAGVVTLLPAMHRARAAVNQAGCMYNLHQIGLGLGQYAVAHHGYPTVEPQQYVLSFAVKLKDTGCLSDMKALDCPCPGVCDESTDVDGCLGQLRNPPPSPKPLRVRCDYAYNVGHRRDGRPVGIDPAAVAAAMLPLLADQPGYDDDGAILAGNSPNHNGRGQNILFHDQSVRWYRVRRLVPDDGDLYLNRDAFPTYGLHPADHALVPGAVKVIWR